MGVVWVLCGIRQSLPTKPRFRSGKNAAVLGSIEPRQVPAFFTGFLLEDSAGCRITHSASRAEG